MSEQENVNADNAVDPRVKVIKFVYNTFYIKSFTQFLFQDELDALNAASGEINKLETEIDVRSIMQPDITKTTGHI